MVEKEKEFESFFKSNYTRFYYFALQMVEDAEVCRDIVGDAFEQTWMQMQKSDVNLSGYMYALVRHKCVDYVRHEMARTRYADFCQAMYAEADDDEADREQQEQMEQIDALMDGFTPKTQQILKMCYYQKKSYQETADQLGISVSAVRKHIVNALKSLRASIIKKN